MIQFVLVKRGIFRWAAGTKGRDDLAGAATQAWVQALSEFASGKLPAASPKQRFDPSAFGRFGYRSRTEGYQDRQLRAQGEIRPFYSPRRLNFAKVAEALLRPSSGSAVAALNDLARQSTPRLADVITTPGIGWIVRASGKNRITVRLIHPAARVLNRRPTYAREFADLKRGGQLRAIKARAQQIFHVKVGERLRDAA